MKKAIWNSGNGYDLALVVGEPDWGWVHIELQTGHHAHAVIRVPREQVIPYDSDVANKLAKKYGYEKTWSTIF